MLDNGRTMPLTTIDESLVLSAYFRGGSQDDPVWTSNSDQILTLSLFYTGTISVVNCVDRFADRSYIQNLYDDNGDLHCEIAARYEILRNLLEQHCELIEGGGDFVTPADPTYTSCRLTEAGVRLSATLVAIFPTKPDLPNWPDKRALPHGPCI